MEKFTGNLMNTIESVVGRHIYEDIVTCEECGTEIVHLVCGDNQNDPNYRICSTCLTK